MENTFAETDDDEDDDEDDSEDEEDDAKSDAAHAEDEEVRKSAEDNEELARGTSPGQGV